MMQNGQKSFSIAKDTQELVNHQLVGGQCWLAVSWLLVIPYKYRKRISLSIIQLKL